MMEEYKDIPGYEGFYQVSNLGNIKSLNYLNTGLKKVLKPWTGADGYFKVELRSKGFSVHQLVAMAFLGHIPCGHKLVINHINFDKKDNRLENLEIVTNRENSNLKHKISSSKYVGVHWKKDRNKWRASIQYEGKNIHLGYFTDELEASKAYENFLKTKIIK